MFQVHAFVIELLLKKRLKLLKRVRLRVGTRLESMHLAQSGYSEHLKNSVIVSRKERRIAEL